MVANATILVWKCTCSDAIGTLALVLNNGSNAEPPPYRREAGKNGEFPVELTSV